MFNWKITLIASLSFLCSSLVSAQPFSARPEVQAFISQMVTKHHLDANKLTKAFSLYESSPEIIAKISAPYEEKPWHTYRTLFITKKRINGGKEFWKQHKAALKRAQKEYGVPAEIIVAIIGVETFYGENAGKFPVLQSLATLAFDYPKRAVFFNQELEQFLLLCHEENLPLTEIKGSYAGAMGIPQFISSSYRNHAVDFAKIGKRDLINNAPNAIGSVANYLKTYGWVKGQGVAHKATIKGKKYHKLPLTNKKNPKPEFTVSKAKQNGVTPVSKLAGKTKVALLQLDQGKNKEYWLTSDNFYAITRYNHSAHYAMAVYQLSQEIKKGM